MSEKLAATPKVLIVSNQQTTGPLWVFSLQQLKLHVAIESVPANALARLEKESPNLMILDLNLPESQTLDLVRELRAETLVPVLLLAFARTEEFMLEAYHAGIDDFLPKPVSPSLFQAKVSVWLRRFGGSSADLLNPIKVGTLQVFPAEKIVFLKNGAAAHLTNLELRLLYYLMQRPGQLVTFAELNQSVWGYTGETDNTMLKNVVYRLRRKIEADPANPLIIQTVSGAGYRLAGE